MSFDFSGLDLSDEAACNARLKTCTSIAEVAALNAVMQRWIDEREAEWRASKRHEAECN